MNRKERRAARAAQARLDRKLKDATLDEHFNDMLGRVRAEFEGTGQIHSRFECVTDGDILHVPAHWPNPSAKTAAYLALRDSFRHRGVNRYVYASEARAGTAPGVAPADDPAGRELVLVIAVKRNGPRRFAFAHISRNGERTTLGAWQLPDDVPPGWLFELLEEGHSDRAPKAEPPPVPILSAPDLQNLLDEDSEQAAGIRESVEIHEELGDLMADQLQKDADGHPQAMFMALESALLGIVKDMGSPKGTGGFARFLKDHPDKFPIFSAVPDHVPSTEHLRRCKATLRHFICEKRQLGQTDSAIFGAFINTYMYLGSQVIGALNLAERIENWDPEHQAKLREVGLRSSYELDDEEGKVFVALSADRYPIGVMGRRNVVGDLFVSRIVACPESDFATAVAQVKQRGLELILGSEAKELLCKMEQVKGSAPWVEKTKQIWELENWGDNEWVEQALAEMVFAKAMNIKYLPEHDKLRGYVAGCVVRRAPNGLVLLPSDDDEDIFVAVRVEKTEERGWVLGWLRGSEAKLPQFYQKNCWVIPSEALHDLEKLPDRGGLQTMPPSQEED